ncbi:MAG: hypothetical protein H6Q04_2321 [Acidobacteria bacterium]|nr:hypothetical protein [Acidobacteriota bacterium]
MDRTRMPTGAVLPNPRRNIVREIPNARLSISCLTITSTVTAGGCALCRGVPFLRAARGKIRAHSLRQMPQGASSGVQLPDKEFRLELSGKTLRAVCRKACGRDPGSCSPPSLDLFDPARVAGVVRARTRLAEPAVPNRVFAVSGNGRKLGNKTREIFQGKRRGIPLLMPPPPIPPEPLASMPSVPTPRSPMMLFPVTERGKASLFAWSSIQVPAKLIGSSAA